MYVFVISPLYFQGSAGSLLGGVNTGRRTSNCAIYLIHLLVMHPVFSQAAKLTSAAVTKDSFK